MHSVLAPILVSHLLTSLAVNPGPLSERISSGIPLLAIKTDKVSITSFDLMCRPALMARHDLCKLTRRIPDDSRRSDDAMDKEIAYRRGQEASEMRRLSDNELEVVFKNGWKPSEYLASRDG